MSQSKRLSSELLLPYDVVFDILTRLPVKSLVRFRCVSKSWNSFITSPVFIKTHFDLAKSLSHNNNGYLLYNCSSRNELCTVVCNSDHTLNEISRFQIPCSTTDMVGFCNGMFCFYNSLDYMCLWNPRIRKYKMLPPTHSTHHFAQVATGLAYHSQNNDFKILRLVPCNQGSKEYEAEVYTLSTNSWRNVVISVESDSHPNIGYIDRSPCLFFNGALHSVAFTGVRKFILSFDVNDERFREIMLPQNHLDDIFELNVNSLAVFKGSLALFVGGFDLAGESEICYIWVMREYGVVDSWTKIIVTVEFVKSFFGCNDSVELLIDTYDRDLVSYYPESLNENNLGIQSPQWLSYTADLMENLVLLDQHNEAEMEPDTPLSPERNPREATNTSSDARPFHVNYPFLPLWEVQVMSDSREDENHDCFALKACSLCAMDGRGGRSGFC